MPEACVESVTGARADILIGLLNFEKLKLKDLCPGFLAQPTDFFLELVQPHVC